MAFGLPQHRLSHVTPRGSPALLTSALLSELSVSTAAQESRFLSPPRSLPGTSSCRFSAIPSFRAPFMTNSTPEPCHLVPREPEAVDVFCITAGPVLDSVCLPHVELGGTVCCGNAVRFWPTEDQESKPRKPATVPNLENLAFLVCTSRK